MHRVLLGLCVLATTSSLLAQPFRATYTTKREVAGTWLIPPSNRQLAQEECPHSGQATAMGILGARRVLAPLALAGTYAEVPEYNDCQRLLAMPWWQARDYGPLAAVFVRDPALAPDSLVVKARAAAAVIHINGDYPRLGLTSGVNCLYVRPAEGVAYMLNAGADGGRCLRPLDADATPRRPLSLQAESVLDGRVVNAARWDDDVATGLSLVGVRCGVRWCTVGPMRPRFVRNAFAASGAPFALQAVLRGVGAYDAQPIMETTVIGTIRPTRRTATLVPEPDLATLKQSDFAGTWRRVANVHLQESRKIYVKKYLWYAGALPGQEPNDPEFVTTFELCDLGPTGTCPDVPLPIPCTWNSSPAGGTPAARMIGRYRRKGEARYVCVKVYPHTSLAHGLVRFRWRADDETVWVRCPMGCCEADRDDRLM